MASTRNRPPNRRARLAMSGALTAIGIVQNPDGAAPEIGRGFAPLLPWRKDAKEEARLEKEKKREAEIGELGLHRPFTDEDLLGIERTLALPDDARALRLQPGFDEISPLPAAADTATTTVGSQP